MCFDGEQHLREFTEHMRTDRLALIGAAKNSYWSFVRRNTKMIGPKPNEALRQTNSGVDSGIVVGLGFAKINTLRERRTRLRSLHQRRVAAVVCRSVSG